MKTNLIETKLAFDPVHLNVTFESQEELDLFMSVLRFNESIPKMVCKSVTEQKTIKTMLDMMRKTLGA